MAVPTYGNEGGGDKVLGVVDAAEAFKYLAAIEISNSPAGYGWMGVATHVEDDAVASPGGFTASKAPLVLVGGDDGENVKALQVGAGTAAGALRATLASDDPGVALLGTIDADTGAIKTAVELLDNAVDGNYLDVNANIAGTDIVGGAGAVAAGVQRVTLASDDPAVALLTTMDADTGSMLTALQLLDNAVDGNYLNVNLNMAGSDAATAAGVVGATVQRVTLASDDPAVALLTTIDADMGTIDADTGAIKTAVELLDDPVFADDAAFTLTSSKVMMVGAFVDDALGALGAAEGDAVPLRVNSTGALHVTGGGGGTEYVVNAAAPADPTGTAGLMERDDIIAALGEVEGDWTNMRATAEGALWVQDFNSDAILAALVGSLDVSGATVTVDLGANNDVTIDSSSIVQAEDAPHGNGDAGVMMLAVRRDAASSLAGADNDYLPLTTDSDGKLYVNIADGGNTITVDGTIVAGDTAGDAAHDAGDTGNPVKMGGRAQEPTAQPDEVADEDRVDALFDRNGYQRVRGDFNPLYADINDAVSGNNTIVAAAGAGKRIAVWSILIVSDGTTDVRWEDGAGGTAFTGQIPLQAREGYSISAGGFVPLFAGTANTLLNLELTAAVNVHGFVSYSVMDD